MGELMLVATKKGVFTARRGRQDRWALSQVHFLGDHHSLVHADRRSGRLYAAAELGHFGIKLFRSEDGGAHWTEIGKPTYPEKPEGLVDVDPFRGKPIPWNVERVWAMASEGEGQTDRLWLGCIPGGLFWSDDHGDSWTFVRSLWDHPDRKRWVGGGAEMAGIHSICIDPRDEKVVRVGVSCGGVWESRDRGETWNVTGRGQVARFMPPELATDPVTQDPHLLVQCRAEPQKFWIQHHCGIFRSTDACASFAEIERAGPSTFGFAVAVHPKHGDTAWFVPAVKDECRVPADGRLVVTRTTDGGRSFDELRRGLPQIHAYDIAYRHALDVDADGKQLAFGTTTGSLYVTHDGGDSWQAIGEHLPPIDAVRFA